MVTTSNFNIGTDDEIIERAIAEKGADGIVVIEAKEDGSAWLLDRAILLPENTTVILRSCKIKLSDKCRDNFFRSANCGFGIEDPKSIKNIRIIGEGNAVLEGADHPRSTGDSSKILANPCPYLDEDLCKYAYWINEENRKAGKPSFSEKHDYTFGTDTGKEGESQYGDWRNIGILLAKVENFAIENIKIVDSHGWAISLEDCAFGRIEKIEFDMRMSKEIDGMLHNIENQDGIDIRNGCHDIIITDITGHTGDDIVALTAIAGDKEHGCGSLRTTHVLHNDWARRDKNIHDIVIKNVKGYSTLCLSVRLLAVDTKIWNVVVDGIVDTVPREIRHWSGVAIGEFGCGYGNGEQTPDCVSNVCISNVIADAGSGIEIGGYLKDSVITNVMNKRKGAPTLKVRAGALENVKTQNVLGEIKML